MALPLYKKTYDDLRQKIERGYYPLNSYLPTEKELQDIYDVSSITIKKAMDLLNQDGFILRKPKVGTLIIKNRIEQVNERQKAVWGVIMTDFDDCFGAEIVKGIMTDDQHRFIFELSHGDMVREEKLIDELLDFRIDGLLLLPCSSQYYSKKLLELSAQHFPVVVLDRTMEGLPICSVQGDNKQAAIDLTSYLFTKGHQTIGMVTSNHKLSTIDQRINGFISAHLEHGVALLPSQILSSIASVGPNSTQPVEADLQAIKDFLTDHHDLTALIATEYRIALLIELALKERHLSIPNDLSVVCFDNYPNSDPDHNRLYLTHIKQDQKALSQAAISLLDEKSKNPQLIKQIAVGHHLIKGNSVKVIKLS